MKYGNYTLNAPPKEKSKKLELFRLAKLKSTTNNFVGCFQNKIETFRRLKSRSESPLSFRASLFENDGRCPSRNSSEKFSPHDFPNINFSEENFYVFGNSMKNIGLNRKAISGRSNLINQNLYSTLQQQSSQCSTRTTNISPSPMRPPPLAPATKRSRPVQRQNSTLKDILDSTSVLDEDLEFKVLKEYFDSHSYSDIVRDTDFKDYLNKKKYDDILEYINDGSAESSTSTGLSNSPAENEYLFKKNCRNDYADDFRYPEKDNRFNKNPSNTFGRLNRSKSKSTGNLYESCRFNSKIDTNYSKENPGWCNSLKRLKNIFTKNPKGSENEENSLSYKCKKNCKHLSRYDEVKKCCEIFLNENLVFNDKLNGSVTLARKYTPKGYTKLIQQFIKSKGYENVDQYVRIKFGYILDQTIQNEYENSKNYIQSIEKRYHLTKQQFLNANKENWSWAYGNERGYGGIHKNPIDRFPYRNLYDSTNSSGMSSKYHDYCFYKRHFGGNQRKSCKFNVDYEPGYWSNTRFDNSSLYLSKSKVIKFGRKTKITLGSNKSAARFW